MEVVLARLRDFSCRAATFDSCPSTGITARREPQRETGSAWRGWREQCVSAEGSRCCWDIESALAWLRKELIELRSQDQALVRQLMELHAGLQELRLECAEGEQDQNEARAWDSGSDTGSLSVYSSSGEVGCSGLLSSTSMAPFRWGYSSSRAFSRRSSMP
ncbi:alanine and arginine-rich domain-containing protein-like [Arapaima gigas]